MSKPVHEIRLGLIKAAIWHNLTRAGERHNVTLTRLFRNGDTWKESNHFGRDDLLLGREGSRSRPLVDLPARSSRQDRGGAR